MTEANPAEYRRHRNSGTILITIAGFLLVLVILLLTLSVYQGTIILAILAIIVGNYAFNHFEKAATFRPIAPIIHGLELFSSALKNGGDVNVLLEIHYPSEQDSPLTLDRIKIRLQRTLNVHLSRIEALSADPY